MSINVSFLMPDHAPVPAPALVPASASAPAPFPGSMMNVFFS